ncbi:MAG: hypothetical protein ACE5FL_01065 [Myxococcota bacterium]
MARPTSASVPNRKFASGTGLRGYLFQPHAFGLFVGDDEFAFNTHLAGAPAAGEEKLAAARDVRSSPFPLRYATGLRDHEGNALEGSIERYW